MGKKGGKKAKGPTYYVEDEHCIPYGFRANDIIKTPLGLTGTVIGVKYENPEDRSTGRLWVGARGYTQWVLVHGGGGRGGSFDSPASYASRDSKRLALLL